MKDIIKIDEGSLQTVKLELDIIRENQRLAEENRKLLIKKEIRAFDVMGSVGSGKTSLIENLVKRLKDKYTIAVVNGDLATTVDAEIISRHGVSVVQINTGKECHLDANIVRKALDKIDLEKTELIFIENVGNLICPSDFQLGSEKRILVVGVTEGQYVAVKHPISFLSSDIVVVNKIDLAELVGVNVEVLEKQIKNLNPKLEVVKINCRSGFGVDGLINILGL